MAFSVVSLQLRGTPTHAAELQFCIFVSENLLADSFPVPAENRVCIRYDHKCFFVVLS